MSEARQPQLEAEGLVNLRETLKENEGKKIFIMFIGSIVEEGEHVGESWCPDCRDAEPVVEAALQQASPEMTFILALVGDKPVTSEFKLTEVPTIVEYGTDKRLGCEDCKVQDKVNSFFPK
ncbi:Thioredoxin domain-containing protein 17 [Acropora cervicornis]|uniref:Thioredoxin domain-containing protein 17 n=1 Tax=Acropora cervicornis TaxID=6130 RepID=A0AAD9VHA4_ACRCE|nr:Thioredoxin domain-containing protein 17 [Acropora cervicornis]